MNVSVLNVRRGMLNENENWLIELVNCNSYINQHMPLIKHNSGTSVKLLHVSAPACHDQGVIPVYATGCRLFNSPVGI
jgi:hypothetical protein